MGKTLLIVIALLILGTGIWFVRLGGPGQLDLADRLWPGKAEPISVVAHGPAVDIYVPQEICLSKPSEGAGRERSPTLIFIHGGSWRDGEKEDYGFVGRAFAARGMTTYIVNYRKLPKYRFPAFIEDAAKFIAETHRKLTEDSCQDPNKIFVMGHSAGAHIAAMVALDPKWLAAHGTDPSIISGIIGLAGPYDFHPFTSDAAKDALGHWPRPEETQPIHYARGDAPPMLLLSGEDDTTVKPRNSHALAKAIAAKGGKAEVKLYPKVDHADIVMAISRAFRAKAPVVQDVVDFTRSAGPARE